MVHANVCGASIAFVVEPSLNLASLLQRYDLYTTIEPGVFEAMALVHSRIRRVVFGISNCVDGGLGGTGMETAVHALPTNHHYRVFCCAPDSELFRKCKEINPGDDTTS